MKNYLAWAKSETLCPEIASSPPLADVAGIANLDVLALCANAQTHVAAATVTQTAAAGVFDCLNNNTSSSACTPFQSAICEQPDNYKNKLINFFNSLQQAQQACQPLPTTTISTTFNSPAGSLDGFGGASSAPAAERATPQQNQLASPSVAAALLAAAQQLPQLSVPPSTAAEYLLAALTNQQSQQVHQPPQQQQQSLNAALVAALQQQGLEAASVAPSCSSQQQPSGGAAQLLTCSANSQPPQAAAAAAAAHACNANTNGFVVTSAPGTMTVSQHSHSSTTSSQQHPQQQPSTASPLSNSNPASIVSPGVDEVAAALKHHYSQPTTPQQQSSNLALVAAALQQQQQNHLQPSVAEIYAAASRQAQQHQHVHHQGTSQDSQEQQANAAAAVVAAAAAAAANSSFLNQAAVSQTLQMVQNSPLQLSQQPFSPQQQQQNLDIRQPMQQSGQQTSSSDVAASLYPQLLQSLSSWPTTAAVLLDRLGPQILRSNMNQGPQKPIPNFERVDLAKFKLKEPADWTMDDVIAWLLDVAKRNNIPAEDLSTQFARCTGSGLLCMNEQQFCERDPAYGSLLFAEFRKLVKDDQCTLDDWIRSHSDDDQQRPSTSHEAVVPVTTAAGNAALNSLLNNAKSPLSPLGQNAHLSASSLLALNNPALQQLQRQNGTNLQSFYASQQGVNQQSAQQAMSQITQQQHVHQHTHNLHQQHQQQQMLRAQQVLQAQHNPQGLSGAFGQGLSSSLHNGYDSSVMDDGKIRKNKDGRPRKRSQHTKGNKLWEFIRDALKDPITCPTVVRWEDPEQGVFRIVESEKLARLWGEKKNNQKMTYEKLSRAMRTYYEKQILVPVPKTGLYPKKLVYKFGPGAHGWTAPAHLAQACLRLQQQEH